MKIKRLLIWGLLAFATGAWAQTTFEEGGIMYLEDTSDPSRMAVYVVAKPSPLSPAMSAYSGDIVVPSRVEHDLDTYEVIGIAQSAFFTNEIKSLVISEGVSQIAQGAISSESLKKLVFPSTVKSLYGIGGHSIEEIDFGNGLESIRYVTLGPVESLKFPEPLKTIEGMGIHSQMPEAGGGYTNTLAEIVFGNNIESIKMVTAGFKGESLIFPSSVKTIQDSFNDPIETKKFVVEKGVGEINQSFRNFSSIEDLTVGAKKIYSCFFDISNLKNLKLEEGIESIEGSFANLKNYSGDIVIPATVSKISNSFKSINDVNKLVIPNSVSQISNSFEGIGYVKEIVFGTGWSNVKSLYKSFEVSAQGATKKVYCPWQEVPVAPSFNSYVKNGESTLEIYVPKGMTAAYTDAWNLGNYAGVKVFEMK